ncbi:MAG: hypothetical protein K2L42_07015 [Clostridia bacterium]|nr:hypothetical protein [Clostridia bacterium]
MAEERLIDDDKDRKYKIRINEDGEEELVIDSAPEEEEESREEIEFEVPDLETDDEEAAVMTPEQLAAREQARAREEEKRLGKLAEYSAQAKRFISEGKFGEALYVLEEAETLGNDGLVSALKLQALTCGYTDFSRVEECSAAADVVSVYADKETKAEHAAYAADIAVRAKELGKRVEELNSQNEEQRAERQVKFLEKRKRALIWFAVTAVPMLVFAVLSIYFSTIMHAQMDHKNMILCFVFAGGAGVFFLASLFTAHKLWESVRLLKLNAKNSSTKLGREYEEKKAQYELMNKIMEALKENV